MRRFLCAFADAAVELFTSAPWWTSPANVWEWAQAKRAPR